MSHDDLSREELVARLETERRGTSETDNLLRELRACQLKLEAQNRALREGQEARDDALSIVTHDLGNFLSSIAMASDLLARTITAGERQSGGELLDAIGRATHRMQTLLTTLGDAGLMVAGCFHVDRRPDQLQSLLAEAVATLRPCSVVKRIRLSLRVPDDLPWVVCDRERIHQVLANLVRNAVQHTPEGGTITLEAARAGQDTVRVAVSDTGSGIPSEDLPHLFDRYWRKGPRAQGGAGLGLFIAHGIITIHDGQLWVKSDVGRGTTFFFTLPVAERQPPAATATS